MRLDLPVFEQLEDRQLLAAAPSLDAATALNLGPAGQITQSAHHTAGAMDLFKFTATATGTVTIELTASDGVLDPTLRALSTSNRLLAISGDISRTNRNSRVTIKVTKGTTYVVSAAGNRNTAGDYSLKLTSQPTDDIGNTRSGARKTKPTIYGAISGSGKTNYPGDIDVLSVVANKGGTMTLKMKGSIGLVPEISVYDANGNWIADGTLDASGNDTVAFSAQVNATYYVRLSGASGGVGSYTYSGAIGAFGDSPAMMRSFELAVDGRVQGPLIFEDGFRTQVDLYGYNPQFKPEVVSFSPSNQPFMLEPNGETPAIQTLRNGTWVTTPIIDIVKKAIPNFKWSPLGGEGFEQRIVFDKSGDAYMLVHTWQQILLLHSRDNGVNWNVYPVTCGSFVYLEHSDADKLLDGPPAIMSVASCADADRTLQLVVPTKNADGTLNIPQPVTVTPTALTPSSGSNGSSVVGRYGSKIFLAWAGSQSLPGQDGTPNYVASYDTQTGQLSQPVLLGVSGAGAPDPHRAPALVIDSKGYLHALVGSHCDRLVYKVSTSPGSIDSWTAGEALGTAASMDTYPSLAIDQNDTLHMVFRSNTDIRCNLAYRQKKAGQDWAPEQLLIDPGRSGYANYLQKLSVDRQGRLFVNYYFYTDWFTQAELNAYEEKWPATAPKLIPTPGFHGDGRISYIGLEAQDPGMLISDDGGATWYLATTQDFSNGMHLLLD